MADIKMINDYYIKDEAARNEIEKLRAQIPNTENFATKDDIGNINAILDSINGDMDSLNEQLGDIESLLGEI